MHRPRGRILWSAVSRMDKKLNKPIERSLRHVDMIEMRSISNHRLNKCRFRPRRMIRSH